MKKGRVGYVCVLSLLIAILNLQNSDSLGASSRALKQPFAEGQILIKLRENQTIPHSAATLESLRSLVGAKKIEALNPALGGDSYIVNLDSRTSVEEAVARAAVNPQIEYAGPNYYCFPADTVPDDPLFEFMWNLRNNDPEFVGKPGSDISAVRAWDFGTGNRDLVVAVIDTGIDLSHPDLADNVWVNPREIPGNNIDDDSNGYVDDVHGWNFLADNNRTYDDPAIDYHGTHVAGTLGAVGNNGIGITGVAWRVKIMALKILDGRENRGLISNAIRAMNYVTEQKRRGVNVVAVNASWVTPGRSRPFLQAIEDAGKAGVLLVCAAGNEATDLDEEPTYPAAETREIESVISVAALDRFDNIAPFSNYGHDTVTIGAPGLGVLSLAPDGGYAELAGTSMASPHVAGIIVLLKAQNPDLTPAEAKRLLISTADPVPTLGAYTVCAGRANAYNALARVIPPIPEPSIGNVEATKRVLTINGIGFLSGSSIIEVDGRALPAPTKYKRDYIASNDMLTQLTLKLGRKGMSKTFPLGVPVTITVFNPSTGQRSQPLVFTRLKGGDPQ